MFKSGTCAAFSFALLLSAAGAETTRTGHAPQPTIHAPQSNNRLQLSKSPVWRRLLHLHQGKPQISDSNFLITWPRFSPEAELLATVDLIRQEGQKAACRFPARTFWLQNQGFEFSAVDTNACPEILEFTSKAPFERLELIFADESVTQPASILGHSFLSFEGSLNDRKIQHAVSFYTHAETINLPKLLWESLITGKEGIFALTPWAIEEKKYLEDEQRNLWRYEIKTDPYERALIRNHLFELRHARLTYFFQNYNCATLLNNILGLTGKLPDNSRQWTTPKDVVKDAYTANLVTTTRVQLSDAWLTHQVASRTADAAPLRKVLLASDAHKDLPNSRSWQVADKVAWEAYNRWLLKNNQIDETTFEINARSLAKSSLDTGEATLSVESSLNPLLSEGETHIQAIWQKFRTYDEFLFKWTPVSHSLMQSHSKASAETELALLSPTLSVRQGKFRIHALDIFSMKSLIPWDTLLRSKSAQALISYGRLTEHPLEKNVIQATFQLGFTYRIKGIDLFSLAGPGIKSSEIGNDNAFLRWDTGGLIRHGQSSKTRLTWSIWTTPGSATQKIDMEHARYLRQNWVLTSRYVQNWRFNQREESIGLSLIHSF